MNRRLSASGIPGAESPQVPLSDLVYDEEGNPVRFQFGYPWVECLYPYVMEAARRTDQNSETFCECPNAGSQTYPDNSPTARMTYAFNYCLTEQPSLLCHPEKLMMLREVDRHVNSLCRPINNSCIGTSSSAPQSPLLNEPDVPQSPGAKLHGDGSYIVFADGHVKHFTVDYYPERYCAAQSWDDATARWYNYGPNAQVPAEMIMSIAITP